MKVVGTGGPEALTIRFERCELEILLDELRHRRSVIVEEASRAEQRVGRTGQHQDLEETHGELLTLAKVLDQVEVAAPDADAVVVQGPTWFLHDVIRGAAAEACERLRALVDDFRERDLVPRPTPDQLREAVRVAGAWAETLVAYYYVDGHGFE